MRNFRNCVDTRASVGRGAATSADPHKREIHDGPLYMCVLSRARDGNDVNWKTIKLQRCMTSRTREREKRKEERIMCGSAFCMNVIRREILKYTERKK